MSEISNLEAIRDWCNDTFQEKESGGSEESITVDDALNAESTNPVQNKVITDKVTVIEGLITQLEAQKATMEQLTQALTEAKEYADSTYTQSAGYTDKKIADLVNGAPTTLDTLKEIADALESNESVVDALESAIGSKASAVEVDSHINNTTVHITESERTSWTNKLDKTGDASNVTNTFLAASTLSNLTSGEKLSVAFGKIAKAISSLISHITMVATSSVLGHVKPDGNTITAATDGTISCNQGFGYAVCSTAAATAAKTVACAGFELKTGASIKVRFTISNTAANATLNVNSTGAKAIRYRNAAITAGYLAANRTYEFVYDGTVWQLVGDIDTNTDTDTYDRLRYSGTIMCGSTAIVAGNLIVGYGGTYSHLKLGNDFDIRYPIMYASGAVAAGSVTTLGHVAIHMQVTTTQSITLTAYLPVYIKGTLSGNIFTPANVTPLTQDEPAIEDGYDYMLLGIATSTTTMYLLPEHPIYKCKTGYGFSMKETIIGEMIGDIGMILDTINRTEV